MRSVADGTPWLCLFGRPALITGPSGPPRPLDCRYRKTTLLMAWLAAHAGRPQQRALLAERLWPRVPVADARGNLRVLVNDLVSRLVALGLSDCLEADRDWLCLRPGNRFLTDEAVLEDYRLLAAFLPIALERLALPWLPAEGIEVEGELAEWLAARQAWFTRHAEARLAEVASPSARGAGPGGSPASTHATAPTRVGPSTMWQHLALLHLIPAPDVLASDEKKRFAAARARCLALAAEAGRLGARVLEADSTLTLAFGLDESATVSRWHALRTALSLRLQAPTARIGLAAGMCLIDAGRVFGERLDLARRLALCADEGEIIADAGFSELAASAGAAETCEIRICDMPITAYRFRHPVATPPPGAILSSTVPFIGRNEELAQLSALVARGAGAACLVAPPGIGKSRLAWEVVRTQERERTHWIGCRAELAAQPWAALYEYLSRAEVRARLDGQRHAAVFHQFLAHRHMNFEWRGEMIAALAELFGGGVVVIDDAHWLDAPCARLFDEIARRVTTFWLLTRRPVPGGWLPSGTHLIDLPPLDDANAFALLDAAAGPSMTETERRAAILRCRGIPLLLLAECRGKAAIVEEGLARLTTFSADQARLLGLAALLGQNFRRSELMALAPDAPVDEALAQGTERRLIVPWSEDQFGFSHPMLRERCLDHLDAEETQRLARHAAAWLANKGESARAAELYELGEEFESARATWLVAAQKALADEDVLAACSYFDRVERLGYSAGAAGEWERIHHARALIVREGYGIEAVDRLVGELARRPPMGDDPEARERHFAANALYYLWSGGVSSASGLAQAKRLAALAQTPAQEYAALLARANTSLMTGNFVTARRDFGRLQHLSLPRAERLRYFPFDPHAIVYGSHAWAGWFLGEPTWQAEIEQAIAIALHNDCRLDECIARCYAAAVYLCAGNREALSTQAAHSFAIASRESFTSWELLSALLMQVSVAQSGQRPDHDRCAGFEAATRQTHPAGLNTVRWLIAEAYAASGDWPTVRALCASAVVNEEGSRGHSYCLPDLWRLLGQALTETGEAPAGRAALHHARALAQNHGAKGWLARWQHLLPAGTPTEHSTARSALQAALESVRGLAPSAFP